jgi:PAS domain S-box-containing protein
MLAGRLGAAQNNGKCITTSLVYRTISACCWTIPAAKGKAMTIDTSDFSGETALRIIEALPDILILVDRQTNILFMNRAPAGIAVENAIGHSVIDYVDKTERETVQAIIQRVFITGQPDSGEIEVVGQNGQVTSYTTRLIPIGRDGIVEQVLLLNAANSRRRQTAGQQQESESQAHILFMTSMDAIMLATPSGEVLAANPAACTIFGRDEKEMLQLSRAALVDATDPRLAPALAERAAKGHFRGELTLIRKDGSKFPGEIASTRFEDEYGNYRTSLFIHDITERKQAEEHAPIWQPCSPMYPMPSSRWMAIRASAAGTPMLKKCMDGQPMRS